MRLLRYLFFCCCICFSVAGYSQRIDTSIISPEKADTAVSTYPKSRIGLESYFQMLKGNFVQQSLSPFHLRGRDLLKTGGFALVTAGVMRLDKSINHHSLNLHDNSGFVRNVSPYVTKFGGRYALFTMIGIGSCSYIFKDHKLTDATLLATQSYLTSGIWVSVIKFVSGRERPSYYNPQTHINEGSWHGIFFQFKKDSMGNKPDGGRYSSFPSGHAAAAFSIATVYAEMYKDKVWVPLVAYTGASLIALSRVTESRHWASDVLVSSALGYLSGKQVVRNFKKLERLNSLTHKKKGSLVLNINFLNKTIMPEVMYTFR